MKKKKIFHAEEIYQDSRDILISDKIDFKSTTVTRDKEGHYIIMKG